jgi:hypothetical protein
MQKLFRFLFDKFCCFGIRCRIWNYSGLYSGLGRGVVSSPRIISRVTPGCTLDQIWSNSGLYSRSPKKLYNGQFSCPIKWAFFPNGFLDRLKTLHYDLFEWETVSLLLLEGCLLVGLVVVSGDLFVEDCEEARVSPS